MPAPSMGEIVHYMLTEHDAEKIVARRTAAHPGFTGAISSSREGNPVGAGREVPLIVVQVWPDEFGHGAPGVNGQAILDGNDTLWVVSKHFGTDLGCWHREGDCAK